MATMKMKDCMERYCKMNGIKMSDHLLRKEDYSSHSEHGNPFSICHAAVGPKKSAKYEDCVQDVKKKEGMK